jgi:hypothetical protein
VTLHHDIYDPPPAPVPFDPPKAERLAFRTGDVVCLVALLVVLGVGSLIAWPSDPTVALMTTLGGSLVILESWFTALGFLHRFKPLGPRARWTIFLAALVPWLVGLGIAAAIMLIMFWVSDSFA